MILPLVTLSSLHLFHDISLLIDCIRYLLIDYYLAELLLKDYTLNRRIALNKSQERFEQYLSRLDTYNILSTADKKLLERCFDSRDRFSLTPDSDPLKRRETVIRRYKEETQLKSKLEVRYQTLPANPPHPLLI